MTVGALKGIEDHAARGGTLEEFFALGLMSWLYRPTEGTLEFVDRKFAKRPEIAQANATAFKAGYAYGETSEDFAVSYEIAPAQLAPGVYRQITGNSALVASSPPPRSCPGSTSFSARVPVTPASSILEELARHKAFGVRTFQAEDEIAAAGAAARRLRRLARRHHLGRAGDRAQAGDDRARDHARAAAPDPRHPARRPFDRDADEAGAGRSPDGALRAQLGEPGARAGGVDAVAVLPRCDRGGADRAQVPHARLPALRRLPRERLRAVADPAGRGAARHLDRVRDGEQGRVPALRAVRDARAAVGAPGHPGSSTGSAGSRRRT